MTIKEICKRNLEATGGDVKATADALNISKEILSLIVASHKSFEKLTKLTVAANTPVDGGQPETNRSIIPPPQDPNEVPLDKTNDPVREITGVMVEHGIQKVEVRIGKVEPIPEENNPVVKSDEQMEIEYKDGIMNCSFCPAEWYHKKAAWEGRDVCLCLPTYGQVPEEHHFNMMALIARYRMALRIEHRGNDSMIARSRNQLAKRFLKTGATWSVWMDSDMVFPMGHAGAFVTATNMRNLGDLYAAAHTIERLISHKKTIVGGCYWDRMGTGRLIAGGSQPILSPIPSPNLAAVDFVGTGCLAVHKDVFAAIAEKFPDTLSDEAYGNETGFFTPIQNKNRMMGEDESFAWRAKESGHPSYLDLGIICGHVGRTIHGMPATGSRI